jgi:hypothetical protein
MGMRVLAILALSCASCAKGGSSNGTGDGGGAGDGGSTADASCGDLCDSDNDGVPNGTDQCPNTQLGETVNSVGCADDQLTAMLENNFPPYGLAWTSGGDLGRAGGLTWTYANINRGDLFHIWWIVCDDPATPCGVTLDGTSVGATEGWQVDAADSDLANGKLVETNATHIGLADGTMPALTGRLTLTIVDANSAPIPIATVGTLMVPARLGAYGAEITGTAFKAMAIIEVEPAASTTWTPYLDYYDAAPTPPAGGSTAVSFGGSFYDK